MFKKKEATPVIDSRYLKVLTAKRDDLKDAIVFICLNEERFGHVDQGALQAVIEQIDKLEPSGVYFPMLHDMKVDFYDCSEFKNKNILITIQHKDQSEIDISALEDSIRQRISNARSITFIHEDVDILEI
jgi:hypothetical protein